MNTAQLTPFFMREPFQAFVLYLADGRSIEIRHPDFASFERAGVTIWVFHKDGELELIDPNLIVSIRTAGPADLDQFVR
ncbi:MAG TPA: hypothetical protein VN541_11800 [Tepidisphaeraceae bacterium]|nr:hypothetical protein [Tepidisphaeraceae bacterium]